MGMSIDTVIQWLKIQRQNRKDFPEIGNDKKIESLDTAISYLNDLQEVKKLVFNWKYDGIDWDSIRKIAYIVDNAETEVNNDR